MMVHVHGEAAMMRTGGGMFLSPPPTNSTTPFVLSTNKFFKQQQQQLSPPPIPQIQLPPLTRRNFILVSFSSIATSILFSTPSQASVDELKRYTDDREGFTLLIPSSWIKVEKAGATVLFEEMNNKINNVGVVVSPVRLNSLGDFGTPQFVADKLIQAEKRKTLLHNRMHCNDLTGDINSASEGNSPKRNKERDGEEGGMYLRRSSYAFESLRPGQSRDSEQHVIDREVRQNALNENQSPSPPIDMVLTKESTKDAEVIGVAERPGHGGLQVYEFEYMLDSTRGGVKRIFSAAFVASKKLYLLNIAYSDKPENPLDNNTKTMLEQVLHSFDTPSSI